jgi:glycosyltransferase involved in cell wall biosynthesis
VLPFAVRSARLVFVTEAERQTFLRTAPWALSRSEVIPLASNIPFLSAGERDPNRVVYFGLIRPRKGLEEFLKAARLGNQTALRFRIVGAPDPRHVDYFEALRKAHEDLAVTWIVGRDASEVAEELASATYAYLPFPDGASERRGSLLSVMGNGVVTLTTRGRHTPEDMWPAAVFVRDPEEAVRVLVGLGQSEGERRRLSEAALQYGRRFSWDEVARRHLELYRTVLFGT